MACVFGTLKIQELKHKVSKNWFKIRSPDVIKSFSSNFRTQLISLFCLFLGRRRRWVWSGFNPVEIQFLFFYYIRNICNHYGFLGKRRCIRTFTYCKWNTGNHPNCASIDLFIQSKRKGKTSCESNQIDFVAILFSIMSQLQFVFLFQIGFTTKSTNWKTWSPIHHIFLPFQYIPMAGVDIRDSKITC